ncbi:MAG: hypothetical protein F4199_02635 [Rhodothermaceae bacterium]|nr:hypothetical protein [Rhodothermaceae bacterium]
MPTNSERTINTKLAECLRNKHPGWTVRAEQTNVFVQKMKQPDIVVSHEGNLTVMIETEFAPAATVESDAQARLGQAIQLTGEDVEQCVAVRLPSVLRKIEQESLDSAVRNARYLFAVLTYDGREKLYEHIERWPNRGWVEGRLDDLADCIETVALSERRVAKGVKILELGVSQAAGYLQFHAPKYILSRLAEKLHQEEGEQTTRMAMAILANAVIFHMRLARLNPAIKGIESHKTEHLGVFPKLSVIEAWRAILDINYWPIFSLASELLKILPELDAQKVILRLQKMSLELQDFGAADIQDLSGRMFQQLITDRKFLATFYTLPASATLLAELAVSRLNIDWSDPRQIAALKMADLACGTGALLGAAYHAFASRYRRTGGDDGLLHAKMMESVLVAADIMPSAVHLTAATLSGMHPDKSYGHTRIINMPYGENGDENGISIGSLDLMQADETRAIFGTGRITLTGKGVVADDPGGAVVEVPHGSMDLIIMNPPFTRPTNHEATGVPIPSFAGFRTKKEEQAKMSARLKELKRGLTTPAGHGNAGLASNFIDLAHAKLRSGGILALVLPASFVQGKAWENARKLIQQHYKDILIVGIATEGSTDRAFSADTGMAEVLLVATRKKENDEDPSDLFMVNILRRPRTQLEAAITTQRVEQSRHDHTQDVGKIRLTETEQTGNFFRSRNWIGFGIREASLAVCMNSLAEGKLLLPRMGSSVSISVCKLSKLGRRGFLDRDIIGRTSSGEPRGPFDLEAVSQAPEYPMLWGHDANRERQLIVRPDRQGISRKGLRKQAAELWRDGASRLHFNRDFQINSQPLAACLTNKPSLGGTAWPNFLTEERWEIPLVLWANTTLGLISFWWAGTRQQQGRSRLTITRLPQLLSIDARTLNNEQLALSEQIFEDFRDRDFLPANEAYRDDSRIALDHEVLISLLGIEDDLLNNLAVLREQWCTEPSVHGGKATKPGG